MLKPVKLKNGLTVLKFPKPSSNTILVGYVAASGSSVEFDKWPSGTSYFLDRMFRYGTDKNPSPKSMTKALEGVGGTYYGVPGQEITQHYIITPSYHQYKATSMMAEIIQHSYFDEKDIEKEKYNLVEFLKQGEFHDLQDASQLALSNLYMDSPLSSPIMGTVDSIIDISEKSLNDYFAHQYRPDKSYLVFAGNFDNKGLMELIDQEWAYWNPTSRVNIPLPPVNRGDLGDMPRVHYKQRGIPYTDISFSFVFDEGYAIKSEPEKGDEEVDEKEIEKKQSIKLKDLAYLLVLNSLIGMGRSSRLWSKAVDEEMLFSNVQSDLVLFKNTGYLQIEGRTENSQFTFALEAVLGVLESLKKTTISINELAKVKEFVKGCLIKNHEDLLYSTMWQVENIISSEFVYELDDLIKLINKVDSNQLRSMAMDLFVPQRMTITTLGTAKETRLVEKLIRKYLGS